MYEIAAQPGRWALWLGLMVMMSCQGTRTESAEVIDTCHSGTMAIAVDQSLVPVMDAEVQMFESTYTQAKFAVRRVAEAEAVALLVADSVKLIAIPRMLRADEEQAIRDQGITPRTTPIGRDGVAVVVSPGAPDSVLTLDQLKRVVEGEVSTWGELYPKRRGASARDSIRLVIDHAGSSILSFLQDSLVTKGKLSRRLYALGSNEAVIDYVNRTPAAIGLIGLAWISDRNDSTANTFLRQVKVVSLARRAGEEAYNPIQFHIHRRNYPLIRKLFLVSRQARVGLASCLASYVAGDKGQLIIHQLDLMPYYGIVRMVEPRSGDYRESN